ncbi:phosphoribosyltransferase family protein [Nguyenibacter vanlangensis]|uniref:Phosphoribosyltransferase family protein n=1 Tax=Nguyenibacter vanlangensis TaxID=1216886 RepID=A0ABZ3DB57_9PROT
MTHGPWEEADRDMAWIYQDRAEAGRDLAERLRPLARPRPLVLALPRGGVPVGAEIARALEADLDLLFVRKIGAPGQEEYGIGAVVDGVRPHVVVDWPRARAAGADAAYVDAIVAEQLREIARQRREYLRGRPPLPAGGRVVIVVDDGIATGASMKAALEAVRQGTLGGRPARLVLAVPVAPPDSLAELTPECDQIVCPHRPDLFMAVGAHYRVFDQVDDDAVRDALDQAGRRNAGAGRAGPA